MLDRLRITRVDEVLIDLVAIDSVLIVWVHAPRIINMVTNLAREDLGSGKEQITRASHAFILQRVPS